MAFGPDPYGRFLGSRCFVDTSPAYRKLWGRSCESLYANPHSFLEAVHREDRAAVQHALRLRRRSSEFAAEYRIIRPDGSIRWIWDRGFPLFDPQDRLNQVVGVAQDITERKSLEIEFRKREAQLTQAQALAHLAIWEWDLVTGALQWSDELYEMFGWNKKRVGLDLAKVLARVHPQDRPAVKQALAKLKKGRQPPAMAFRIFRPDGTQRIIQSNHAPMLNQGGKTVKVFGTAQDITQRLDMEERYRCLVEACPDMVFVNCDGRLAFINPAGVRFLGAKEASQLIGRSVFDFIHPAFHELIRERIAHGPPYPPLEEKYVRLNGQVVDVEVAARPIRFQGRKAIQVVVHDLTRAKRAEEALRKLPARILKARDEERRLVARELHDTANQYLGALAMNLQSLALSWPQRPSPAKKILADSLNLLGRASKELRTMAYLLHPPILDELGLVAAIRDYGKNLSQRSEIKVRLDLPPDSIRLPRETETTLFRVLQESLTNILRHSKSASISIRLVVGPASVKLEVRDAGKGLPRGLLEGSAVRAGLGVGIPAMRERLAQCGGHLEIQSSRAGTLVRALIPLASLRPAARSKGAAHRRMALSHP